MIIAQVLSPAKEEKWQTILDNARDRLKELDPGKDKIIDEIVKTSKTKSRREEFLRAKAYQWLKSLVDDPPEWFPQWFPHKAIQVAHTAFCLKGKLESFKNYMSHTSRAELLKILISKGAFVYLFYFLSSSFRTLPVISTCYSNSTVANNWSRNPLTLFFYLFF